MKNICELNFRVKLFSWTEPSMKIKLTKYFTRKKILTNTFNGSGASTCIYELSVFVRNYHEKHVDRSRSRTVFLPEFSIQGGWGLVGVVNYNRQYAYNTRIYTQYA